MTESRSIFTPEFRLEEAQLVIDQGYTVKALEKDNRKFKKLFADTIFAKHGLSLPN